MATPSWRLDTTAGASLSLSGWGLKLSWPWEQAEYWLAKFTRSLPTPNTLSNRKVLV